MSRMLQIHDDDLSDLERTVPEIVDRLMGSMDNTMRVKVRRVKKILSDVRWGYGPPANVEAITTDPDIKPE